MSSDKEEKTSFFSMMGKENIQGIRQDFVVGGQPSPAPQVPASPPPQHDQKQTQFVAIDDIQKNLPPQRQAPQPPVVDFVPPTAPKIPSAPTPPGAPGGFDFVPASGGGGDDDEHTMFISTQKENPQNKTPVQNQGFMQNQGFSHQNTIPSQNQGFSHNQGFTQNQGFSQNQMYNQQASFQNQQLNQAPANIPRMKSNRLPIILVALFLMVGAVAFLIVNLAIKNKAPTQEQSQEK